MLNLFLYPMFSSLKIENYFFIILFLFLSKNYTIARENKSTIDESSESIQEDQGEMKYAQKELDEVGKGL